MAAPFSQQPAQFPQPGYGQGQPGAYPDPYLQGRVPQGAASPAWGLQQQGMGAQMGPGIVDDAFAQGFGGGIAGNIMRQTGENYFQRGQAFVQSRMGFLSGGQMHYHFNLDSAYVRKKMLMLLAPFLKRWTYTRTQEQIAGGQKYLPPRRDENAPDLYIPFLGLCTYTILASIALTLRGKFAPDKMYGLVSGGVLAWTLHTLLLKALLYVMGISSSVTFLELAAYAGYPFVPACIGMIFAIALGGWVNWVVLCYGGLCMAIFMVRTMKRIIFHEARAYNLEVSRQTYMLFGLAVFQFVYIWWLTVKP